MGAGGISRQAVGTQETFLSRHPNTRSYEIVITFQALLIDINWLGWPIHFFADASGKTHLHQLMTNNYGHQTMFSNGALPLRQWGRGR